MKMRTIDYARGRRRGAPTLAQREARRKLVIRLIVLAVIVALLVSILLLDALTVTRRLTTPPTPGFQQILPPQPAVPTAPANVGRPGTADSQSDATNKPVEDVLE